MGSLVFSCGKPAGDKKICCLGCTIILEVLQNYIIRISVFCFLFSVCSLLLQLVANFEEIVSSLSSVLSPLQWEDFHWARLPG